MTYTYTPKGVCSRKMTVEVEDGIIKNAEVVGGCSGNLQGLTRLIVGMKASEAAEKLRETQVIANRHADPGKACIGQNRPVPRPVS